MTIFKDEYTFSRKCAFIFLLLSSLISAQSAFPRDFSSKIKPRFEIAEIDWPKTEGAASICLWSDDKLAAFSFGVDDNNHGNVDWWLEQCKVYNLHMTWYLVTDRIGNRPGQSPWSFWKKVLDAGHALESHSVTHFFDVDKPEWKGLDWEYSQSKQDIETNFPGYHVMCLAYPGGEKARGKNDPEVAHKYYLAARLFYPGPNAANTVDYFCVHSDGAADVSSSSGDGSDLKQNNYNHILLPNGPHKELYRGWAHAYMHGVNSDAGKAAAVKVLNWQKEHSDKLWAGLMRDVARYGQERDTATLVVDQHSATQISFTLTCRMDDRFDYPLTIKVRIPNHWNATKAVQSSKEIEVNTIEHEGYKYLLVKAVPNKGQVVLTHQ